MELITEKPVKQFDTSAIAKGNLIYAKHSSFLINGKMSNIKLEKEEYPVTGTIDFRS